MHLAARLTKTLPKARKGGQIFATFGHMLISALKGDLGHYFTGQRVEAHCPKYLQNQLNSPISWQNKTTQKVFKKELPNQKFDNYPRRRLSKIQIIFHLLLFEM